MLLISKTAFDLSTSGKIPFPSITLGWRQTSKYGYLWTSAYKTRDVCRGQTSLMPTSPNTVVVIWSADKDILINLQVETLPPSQSNLTLPNLTNYFNHLPQWFKVHTCLERWTTWIWIVYNQLQKTKVKNLWSPILISGPWESLLVFGQPNITLSTQNVDHHTSSLSHTHKHTHT